MIKQLYKRLNPFEIFLILSLLLVLLITLLIYIDKKSSEKLNFYVFKTQEKSILRLITAMEEELANLNLLLNKTIQDETNISKITDKLIIISNNKTILKNFSEQYEIHESFFQKSEDIFIDNIADVGYLGLYIKRDDKIYIAFSNLEKIISENLFSENIFITYKSDRIVYASEYKDFFNKVKDVKSKSQFSIISNEEKFAITSASFYRDYKIFIYAPFKYYYTGFTDKDVKIGLSAFILGTIILVLLFLIKNSINRFIYEKEKFEKLFQLEHEKFQRIVESIEEGVALIDRNYNLIWANSYLIRKIPGIKSGLCFLEITGKGSKCEFCMFEKVFEQKSSFSISTTNFLKESKGHFEVVWAPLFDEKGEVTACVELIRDISKIKDLEAQLIQSEKLSALGLLAGGVAHEINNPLVGILNISQLLARRFDKNSKEMQMLNVIIEAGKETKNIVQNLLDYARQGIEKHEEFDIRESIEFATKIFGSRLKAKKITLENRLSQQIKVKASKGKIHQVFLNLMSNAIDAITDNGVITIDSLEKDGIKTIIFKDNGTGIKPEHIDKIFDPFFTTKDIGKGTGLGLAVISGIIHDIGWDIKVYSKFGEGTEFHIIINQ
ncbi:PAS domain-containing sensor histidine kinase [Calditerrivibrio sp.]|jgi:signal transduction histidine kinase|uniref:PAS domain-containing sensor histidine kinase n=1 Tax=Calditerrivibrio sp. TaxID=2792612 RepID=UPI003D0FA8A5